MDHLASPVVVEMFDTIRMSFIMPSKYEMYDLPPPDNQNIKLHRQRSCALAVISFGGWANDNTPEGS